MGLCLMNLLHLAMDCLIPRDPLVGVEDSLCCIKQFTLSPVVTPQFNSFECLVLSVSAPISTGIATVYRPPKTSEYFLNEFADLLSILCLKFDRTLNLGYFNIHMDKKDFVMTKDFVSLLECFDLKQRGLLHS